MGEIRVIRDLSLQLETNFWAHEFACQCGHPACEILHIDMAIVDRLQPVRFQVGERFIIKQPGVSRAYRCPYQRDARANPKSRHCITDAVDLYVETLDLERMYRLFDGSILGDGGIGIYPDWRTPGVHLDCGPRRRWAQVQGKYVSLAEGWAYWTKKQAARGRK